MSLVTLVVALGLICLSAFIVASLSILGRVKIVVKEDDKFTRTLVVLSSLMMIGGGILLSLFALTGGTAALWQIVVSCVIG